MKLQPAVKKELFHITIGTVALGAVLNLVFFFIGKWDMPVLYGSLMGCAWAIINFLLLGISVQLATAEASESRSKLKLQLSYSLRMLGTIAIVVLGVKLSCFSWIATVIPLLFPRLTIAVMQIMGMYKPDKSKDGEKKE
ncbi:MAG: ATP synthase subunit I [Clostridia bacterium]|nr:ATP synthase subunit I [Clostridia bacterium]NLS85166.1 ATP synthase subunit I [Oscillospiraceae bacterium]